MTEKRCTKCGELKPLDEFYRDRSRKDGRQSWCKACYRSYYRNDEYRSKNLERMRTTESKAYRRSYYQEHNQQPEIKAKIHEQNKAYSQTERGQAAIARGVARRKERDASLPNTLTRAEWRHTVAAFDGCCAYCGQRLDNTLHPNGKPRCVDHVIPVLRGGGYTKDNIVPACFACNSNKRTMDVYEWMAEKGYDIERFKQKMDMLIG